MQILLIEDDESIFNFLKPLLENEQYQVLHSPTIKEAEMLLRTYPIELILLDLGLPDKDGLEFLQEFRQENQTPIIVISARTDEASKVAALDLDADDYGIALTASTVAAVANTVTGNSGAVVNLVQP